MKKAFEILKWLMLFAVIVLLMAFSFKKQEKVKCQQFDVLLAASEDHFVNNEMIHELLKNKKLHPLETYRRSSALMASWTPSELCQTMLPKSGPNILCHTYPSHYGYWTIS